MTQSVTRPAACACGQLSLAVEGNPVLVSQCHCLACQRRTGSTFGVTAFFARAKVGVPKGQWKTFTRTAESGNGLAFHFCPVCGSTVFWEPEVRPELIAVAVGAFADPNFPPPMRSIWAEHSHSWCSQADGPSFGGPAI